MGGCGFLIFIKIQFKFLGINEFYFEWFIYFFNQIDDKIFKVILVLYGEEEQLIFCDYVVKVCNMFMQFGGCGVLVIFVLGDLGLGMYCICSMDNVIFFELIFLVGCFYVILVGVMYFINFEKVISFLFGGFSMYYLRLQWQRMVVELYL